MNCKWDFYRYSTKFEKKTSTLFWGRLLYSLIIIFSDGMNTCWPRCSFPVGARPNLFHNHFANLFLPLSRKKHHRNRCPPCPHQPLHDKINPKECQVASPLVIQGFSNCVGLFQVTMANPRNAPKDCLQ